MKKGREAGRQGGREGGMQLWSQFICSSNTISQSRLTIRKTSVLKSSSKSGRRRKTNPNTTYGIPLYFNLT